MISYMFCDTSALMHAQETIEEMLEENKSNRIVVCSTVLEELDKHKDFGDGERNYKARMAFKFIDKMDKLKKVIYTVQELSELPPGFNPNVPDNKILGCLLYNIALNPFKNIEYILLTQDNGMKVKANMLGLKVLKLDNKDDEQQYKGYIEIYGTEEEIDEQLYELTIKKSLITNEYVIMHEIDKATGEEIVSAGRWDGKEMQDCFAPRNLIPKNGPQQCAIDLMFNDNIPVKIICGGYGSGN